MRQIAFLLAIQFAVLSTQPMWQPLKQAVFGSCGGGSCSVEEMTCSATPTLPCADGNQGSSTDGCCLPFQCCFTCCCFCVQPESLPNYAFETKNTRPSEKTRTLHSASIGGHFQPPELA